MKELSQESKRYFENRLQKIANELREIATELECSVDLDATYSENSVFQTVWIHQDSKTLLSASRNFAGVLDSEPFYHKGSDEDA